jgi:hypothetical protein
VMRKTVSTACTALRTVAMVPRIWGTPRRAVGNAGRRPYPGLISFRALKAAV